MHPLLLISVSVTLMMFIDYNVCRGLSHVRVYFRFSLFVGVLCCQQVTCHRFDYWEREGWEGGWELVITLSNTGCKRTDRQTWNIRWSVGASLSLLTCILQTVSVQFFIFLLFFNDGYNIPFNNYWELQLRISSLKRLLCGHVLELHVLVMSRATFIILEGMKHTFNSILFVLSTFASLNQ